MAAQEEAVPPLRYKIKNEWKAIVVSNHPWPAKHRTLPVGHIVQFVPHENAAPWWGLGRSTFYSLMIHARLLDCCG